MEQPTIMLQSRTSYNKSNCCPEVSEWMTLTLAAALSDRSLSMDRYL
jgi:hypothetical protein